MKELEINIPNDLSEITLAKYKELQSYIETETDENLITMKMVSIICDLTSDEVRGLPKSDYDEIADILIKVLNKEPIWKQRFTLNGIEYAFVPNIDNISFGEYLDLDTYIKNPEDMHKVMSVLYRPIEVESFGRYRLVKYTGKEDMDIMLNAPMDVVKGTMVFFYHLGNELQRNIPDYLHQQIQKITQSNPTLVADGDGIVQSLHSLTENLKTSISLQNKIFTHV